MDSDGSNKTQLTQTKSSEGGASWSPDGTKIAFLSTRSGSDENRFFVIDADGRNQMLIGDGREPSWLP